MNNEALQWINEASTLILYFYEVPLLFRYIFGKKENNKEAQKLLISVQNKNEITEQNE